MAMKDASISGCPKATLRFGRLKLRGTSNATSWKVIRIWECELRNKSNRKAALNKLLNDITCSTVKRYSVEEPDILVAAESESPYFEG